MKRSKPYIDSNPDEPTAMELRAHDIIENANEIESGTLPTGDLPDETWLAHVFNLAMLESESGVLISGESLARSVLSRIFKDEQPHVEITVSQLEEKYVTPNQE